MDHTGDLPTDRLGLEVLPPETCWELLESAPVGRVAMLDAGEPVVFPVTHGVWHHHIVFRTGSGTKLAAAQKAQPLAFEVDEWDPDQKRGWSVLVRGVSETVYEDAAIAELESLDVQPWLDAARDGTWICIRGDEVSGRRLTG